MKKITMRELHKATGHKIVPTRPLPAKPFFASPKFTRAFLAQRKHLRGGTDSTDLISQERDHAVP